MLGARAPVRAHARPLRDRRSAGPLRRGRRPGARGARAGRRARARRAAAAGHPARVVRPRGAAPPASGIAGGAAQGDRAGRRRRRWRGSRRRGRAWTATRRPAPASTGCATCWRRCRACRWRPSSGRRTSCPAGSARTRRTGWTSCARAARWSGSAPVRWAGAPGASRCTSATTRLCSARRPPPRERPGARAHDLLRERLARGACFFSDLLVEYPDLGADELREALWDLVWAGEATNDAFAPLRARGAKAAPARRRAAAGRRGALPSPRPRRAAAAGPLVAGRGRLRRDAADPEARRRAWAELLLERHGVLTRELVRAEGVPGRFLGALPGAVGARDAGRGPPRLLRRGPRRRPVRAARRRRAAPRSGGGGGRALVIATADPAQLYGAGLRWPDAEVRPPSRRAGAYLVAGRRPAGAVRRRRRPRPAGARRRADDVQPALEALAAAVRAGRLRRAAVDRIDGEPAVASPLAERLVALGFRRGLHDFALAPRRCLRATPSTTRRAASALCSPGACPTTSRRRTRGSPGTAGLSVSPGAGSTPPMRSASTCCCVSRAGSSSTRICA